MSDILQVQGINSKGFGTIPKLAMQDRRLTAQAKAIYGYFSSYAGGGNTAFPSVSKIRYDLQVSKSAYYTHFNLLKKYGYIRVEQFKGNGGKYFNNIYTLADSLPCPEFQDTVKNPSPCPNSRDTVQRDTEKRDTVKQDTNSNSINNNSSKNNSLSRPSAPISTVHTDRQDGTDISEEMIINCLEEIREQIDCDSFQIEAPGDLPIIDEIVAVMMDVMLTPGRYVALDGENKPRTLVLHQLRKIAHEHVLHVLTQFKSHTGRIRKKRQYLLTMLYNSAMELDAHYANWVNSDRDGGER